MSAQKFLLENPVIVAAIVAGGVFAFYSLGRQIITDTADTVGGVLSGDNELTRNQTDSDGNATDAYENAGVIGTVGAAANTISGGVFATIGQNFGRWAFDLFGPTVDINPHLKK